MKTKIFLILVIIILFSINVLTLFRVYKSNQKNMVEEEIRNNREIRMIDDLNAYSVNLTANIENSNLKLDNVMIKDSLGKNIPLNEVFKSDKEQMLVFRFSEVQCASCINSTIELMKPWIDSIGIKNVLFLGHHRNNRVFRKSITQFGIQHMNVYNGPVLKIPAEELCYPYYFVLDKGLKISNIFISDKAAPEITNKYFKWIYKVHFQANPTLIH